jgi:hypothetical protein
MCGFTNITLEPTNFMPNIATLLKEEIVRLSRKEFRQQIEPIKEGHDAAAA